MGLVCPVLEYGGQVREACSNQGTLALERFQLVMAEVMLQFSRRTSHNIDVMKKIGWPN